MKPLFEEILKQIKINFKVMGIQFHDPKIHFQFHFFCILIVLMLIAEISYFVSKISSNNIIELSELAPCIFIGMSSLLKIVFLVAKKEMIFELGDCLTRLYADIDSDTIITQVVKLNKILNYYFILNAILISVYNFASPIFMIYHYVAKGDVVFSLPYAILVPFPTDMWSTWFIVYVFSISCGCICVLFFTTVDALFCVFTSQICNNFAILSNDVLHMDGNDLIALGKIVQRHQYLLKLSKDLDSIFRLPNLSNYMAGSLEICALGFSLTTGNWSHFLGYVLFLLSVLLQILMMSVFGENIIVESRKVGEAAYLCGWHDMNQMAKKAILIIMIRSHKQQQLTAFKFTVISYRSFSKIISTSWSYFTILKTVYKPSGSQI